MAYQSFGVNVGFEVPRLITLMNRRQILAKDGERLGGVLGGDALIGGSAWAMA
jgi:predicted membrane-bound spermidine synthase